MPGLTAVWAEELTRKSIFDALWNRRTYATRSERILMQTSVNGKMMGQEFELQDREQPRRITILVAGTAPIKIVEVIHNGEVEYTWRGAGEQDVHLEFEHNEPMTGLPAAPDWGYYYFRVIQDGEGMAWSSPTWFRLPQS